MHTWNRKDAMFVNGEKFGKATPDKVNVLLWENVPLTPGHTAIEVRTRYSSDSFTVN